MKQLARCQATTKAGRQCQSQSLHDSEYCVVHCPSLAEERGEWRRQGGRASSKRAVISEAAAMETADQITAFLPSVISSVRAGTMDPITANAIANLCRLQLRAIELSDLDKRLQHLEEAMKER